MIASFLIAAMLGFLWGFAARTSTNGLDAPRMSSLPGGVAMALLAAWFVFIRYVYFDDRFRVVYGNLMRACMDWCVAEFGIIGLFLAMAVGLAFILCFIFISLGVLIGAVYVPLRFITSIPAFLRGMSSIAHYVCVPYPMIMTVDPDPGRSAAIDASLLKDALDLRGFRLRTARLRREAARDEALAAAFKAKRERAEQQLAEALAGFDRRGGR